MTISSSLISPVSFSSKMSKQLAASSFRNGPRTSATSSAVRPSAFWTTSDTQMRRASAAADLGSDSARSTVAYVDPGRSQWDRGSSSTKLPKRPASL